MNDYFESFLDDDETIIAEPKITRPIWAIDSNSSGAAFDAIQTLYAEKKHFISTHNKNVNFKKKRNYQISKKEVADLVPGLSGPTAIFNTVDYSESLTSEFNAKNESLMRLKETIVKKWSTGNQRKSKRNLLKNLQSIELKYKQLAEKTAETVLEESIQRLPLPIRKKLDL